MGVGGLLSILVVGGDPASILSVAGVSGVSVLPGVLRVASSLGIPGVRRGSPSLRDVVCVTRISGELGVLVVLDVAGVTVSLCVSG